MLLHKGVIVADNDSGIAFVSGFLLGGVIGAAIGMLLAPKSGVETRADLAGQSEVWRHRAEDMAAQINASIAPTIESVRERVEPVTGRISQMRGTASVEEELIVEGESAVPEAAATNGAVAHETEDQPATPETEDETTTHETEDQPTTPEDETSTRA